MFTAAIWGVFTYVTAGKQSFDTSSLLTSNVDQLNAKISNDWKGLTAWDNGTYRRHMTMIAQCHNSGQIDDDARKSLYDRINKEAYTTAAKAMDRQFDLTACDETVLNDNFDGLMVIASKEPGIEKIPDVEKVERLYSLYRRVKNFNNRSFILTPVFNGNMQTWTPSFPAFAANMRRVRDEILSNSDFRSRLSHISEMKKIHQTDSRLNEARYKYYNDLYSQIESYYTAEAARLDRQSQQWKDRRPEFQALRSNIYNETNGNHQINDNLHNLLMRLWN